jgi:hypothetical protein
MHTHMNIELVAVILLTRQKDGIRTGLKPGGRGIWATTGGSRGEPEAHAQIINQHVGAGYG